MKNYKYVLDWSEQAVNNDTVLECLDYAWRYTPSKNNFMNYSVHVLGPDKKELKEELYYVCLKNQSVANGHPVTSRKDLLKYEETLLHNKVKPRFWNIKGAPYAIIYTQRQATETNKYQEKMIQAGMVFEQMFEPGTRKYQAAGKNARLEVGMFASNFATKCLENNIDTAFVGCMPIDIKSYSDPIWDFITEAPILIQLAGHGSRYRQDLQDSKIDLKPNFKSIVNIIS
jgi:hypothetical protein